MLDSLVTRDEFNRLLGNGLLSLLFFISLSLTVLFLCAVCTELMVHHLVDSNVLLRSLLLTLEHLTFQRADVKNDLLKKNTTLATSRTLRQLYDFLEVNRWQLVSDLMLVITLEDISQESMFSLTYLSLPLIISPLLSFLFLFILFVFPSFLLLIFATFVLTFSLPKDICCINTTLIFFIFANRRKQLRSYLERIQIIEEDPLNSNYSNPNDNCLTNVNNALKDLLLSTSPPPISSPTESGPSEKRRGGSSGVWCATLDNFFSLLLFWKRYYEVKDKDRDSLEYFSRIPFTEWLETYHLLVLEIPNCSPSALSSCPPFATTFSISTATTPPTPPTPAP
jgi:hypothetical protein